MLFGHQRPRKCSQEGVSKTHIQIYTRNETLSVTAQYVRFLDFNDVKKYTHYKHQKYINILS